MQTLKKFNDADVLEAEKILCQNDLKYLCRNILKFQDLDFCHDQLFEFLKNSKKNKKLILMPREHLKTSIITIAKSIQHLLQNANLSILYANAIQFNAESFLFETKEYLTTKSDLPFLFGRFDSETWNQSEIRLAQRTSADKTPTISVAGVDKAITSQHYDVIFLDDIVNRQTINTSEQILKTEKFYSDVLDLLKKPNGILYVVGTRWDERDIYGKIISEFEDEFDVFIMSATKNEEVDGEVLFPKKFNAELLKKLLRAKGSYEFNNQYMNRTIPRISRHFPLPVRYWNELPEKYYCDVTVDLAISENEQADNVCVGRCAKTPMGQMFLIEYKYGKLSPTETIDAVFEFVLRSPGSKSRVGIESVQYQKALCHFIEAEQKRRKIFFEIVPMRPMGDKFVRIISCLQPLWERGDLLLKHGMVEAETEFETFPRGRHDDLLDMLCMQTMFENEGEYLQNDDNQDVWMHEKFRKDFYFKNKAPHLVGETA